MTAGPQPGDVTALAADGIQNATERSVSEREAAVDGNPVISVVMANYNGAAWLEAALRSVLSQYVRDIEVIVSDDRSADDSLAVAEAVARADPRVRILAAPVNGGAGACRNRALDAARGEWIAIVDSDDLILPARFEAMLAASAGADIVADNLSLFSDDTGEDIGLHLRNLPGPMQVTPEGFVRSELAGPGHGPLGYLKPMIRRRCLGETRYREDLPVGEDHDLVLRLLLGGARMVVLPEAHYRYRRRAGSASHRLAAAAIRAMIAAQDDLAAGPALTDAMRRLFARRRRELCRELRFTELVTRLKGRDAAGALGLILRDPPLVRNLVRAAREHLEQRETGLAK